MCTARQRAATGAGDAKALRSAPVTAVKIMSRPAREPKPMSPLVPVTPRPKGISAAITDGVVERQLDRDVQQQEGDRGHRGRPVHGLGDQPLARVEEQPVGGDESPDHGAGEGDQRQHAGAEVEEVAEFVTSDQHDDGYEQQRGSRHAAP